MAMHNRPLSPHLQVYRMQWTMIYSILNRATGVALSVGALFLTCWLVALGAGFDQFQTVQDFITSYIGRIMLLGWTWSLIYHLCAGIRHIIWDAGAMLELKAAQISGHLVMIASIVITAVIWFCAYYGGSYYGGA